MKRANFIVRKTNFSSRTMLCFLFYVATLSLFISTQKSRHSIVSIQKTTGIEDRVVASTTKVEVPAIAPAPVVVVAPAIKTDEFVEIEKKLHDQQIIGLESLEREKNSKAIRITLNSDVFFQLGTAKIEETSKESIQQIISILKPLSSMSVIEIEGHTDDSPVIHQKPNYPSNWELSAARAASLIPLFSNNGFFKDQLKVVGYGDSHPLFSNHTNPKISAKNRRIVLRIYTQEDERKI